jgi:hypothetical protein
MRNQGCNCEACYSPRRAYFLFDYGPTPVCWVCKVVTICPAWASGFIYWVCGGATNDKKGSQMERGGD